MNSHTSAPQKNFEARPSVDDPIVQEVRDTRHALAARFDNDLNQIVEDIIIRKQNLGKRLRSK